MSSKLKQAHDNDMQAAHWGYSNFNSNPHAQQYHGSRYGYQQGQMSAQLFNVPAYPSAEFQAQANGYFSHGRQLSASHHNQPQQQQPPSMLPNPFVGLISSMNTSLQETTYLYIPSRSVGSVIGAGGSAIRNIIRTSGASLKISNGGDGNSDERRVTVYGPIEGHWKAQWMLFRKLREFYGDVEFELRMEMIVPSDIVGRLIGKGGARIKAIHESTGARVKFIQTGDKKQTVLQIYGNYSQMYSAQARIRDSRNTINNQLAKEKAAGRSNPNGHTLFGRIRTTTTENEQAGDADEAQPPKSPHPTSSTPRTIVKG